eukprot:388038_1
MAVAGAVHVVIGIHIECLSVDHKRQLREDTVLGAIDLGVLLKSQSLEHHREVALRAHHQRAASVQHALALPFTVLFAQVQGLAVDENIVDLELPIPLLVDGHP